MKKVISLLLIFTVALSCTLEDRIPNSDDDDDGGGVGQGSMTATVNGGSFTAFGGSDTSEVNGSLILPNDGRFFLVVGGSRILGLTYLEGLSVGISGDNFDEVDSGFEVELDNGLGYIVAAGYINTELFSDPTSDLELSSGYFKITSINKSTRTVSGEFNFVGVNVDGETINVTASSFQDIVYDISE